jgi:hypothetical protein
MKEQLITFETAKLAKEKGFDERVPYGYLDLEDGHKKLGEIRLLPVFDNIMKNSETNNFFTAPTQSLLLKWLREVHEIHIDITPTIIEYNNSKDSIGYTHKIVKLEIYLKNGKTYGLSSKEKGIITNNTYSDIYEEALEVGLQEALKLI